MKAMLLGSVSPPSRILSVHPWYTSLPLATQERVQASLVQISGKKGDVMLPAGQYVQGWYAVLSGLVKLNSVPVKGRSSTFLCVAPGDWFGENAAVSAELRRYEVVALRDTELLCLPLQEFDQLRSHCLEFNQFLVKQFSIRLGQAMSVIESGRLRTPEQRVALALSRQFWGITRKLSLSQDEIANLAGVSRQTVNQALKTLAERHLITLEFGRIDIPDDHALTQFISQPSPAPARARDNALHEPAHHP